LQINCVQLLHILTILTLKTNKDNYNASEEE